MARCVISSVFSVAGVFQFVRLGGIYDSATGTRPRLLGKLSRYVPSASVPCISTVGEEDTRVSALHAGHFHTRDVYLMFRGVRREARCDRLYLPPKLRDLSDTRVDGWSCLSYNVHVIFFKQEVEIRGRRPIRGVGINGRDSTCLVHWGRHRRWWQNCCMPSLTRLFVSFPHRAAVSDLFSQRTRSVPPRWASANT